MQQSPLLVIFMIISNGPAPSIERRSNHDSRGTPHGIRNARTTSNPQLAAD